MYWKRAPCLTPEPQLKPSDVNLGSLKRVIQCVVIDDTDSVAYCGTRTGDLLEVNITNGRFIRASKNRFSLGVVSITFFKGVESNHVIVGNGDGSVARLDTQRLAVRKYVGLQDDVRPEYPPSLPSPSLSLHSPQ